MLHFSQQNGNCVTSEIFRFLKIGASVMAVRKVYKITIEENKGITHALKKLIEKMPNSIISDGEITLSEWNATMDKLVELNEKRKSEGKESIFTGGTDKTRNGCHNSFVVHSKQEITFTEEEINELFVAMGVTINKPPVQQEPPNDKADTTKVAPPKVEPPKEKADSTKVAPPKVEPPKEKVDTTKVTETKDESKTEKSKKSNRLSWSEISNIACKSTKKFVKGMFCDEEGKFSIDRTAATVGIVAGLALAAPVTAALGASAAVIGAVATTVKVAGIALTGYMLYNGGKNAIKGTNDYYNAESKEDAVEAMEQAWDGGVELASIPVLGGLIKTGSKLLKFVKPKASTPKGSTGGNEGGSQVSNTQPKPVENTSTEARPVEGVHEGGNQVANTQSTPAEVKPVENSTTNQSSSTQSSSSSQSSVVESQQTTPKVETRLETTSVQSSTKTEPKVQAKPKAETTKQTVAESNNITSFISLNGETLSLRSINSEIFKITKVSNDEAIITITDNEVARHELIGFIRAFENVWEFTRTVDFPSQIIPTKAGKLKLINGQWKVTEPIQITGAK